MVLIILTTHDATNAKLSIQVNAVENPRVKLHAQVKIKYLKNSSFKCKTSKMMKSDKH